MTDPIKPGRTPHDVPIETASQADPYLGEKRVRGWVLWILTAAIVVVVSIVFYGLNAPPQQAASTTPAPSATTGSGSK